MREIQAHLEEMYGAEVSSSLISSVTDAVVDEVKAWQSRPLDPVYPILPQVGWAGLQWPGEHAPLDGKQVVGAASRLNLPRWSPLKGVLWRGLFATGP